MLVKERESFWCVVMTVSCVLAKEGESFWPVVMTVYFLCLQRKENLSGEL